MIYQHTPVLLNEVLTNLKLESNKNYIDATLGLGGHTRAILDQTGPNGKVIAFEQNLEGLEQAKNNLIDFASRIIFINDNFSNLTKNIIKTNINKMSGIILDLGLASWQIDSEELGISFAQNQPLDMRLGENLTLTASDIVNKYHTNKLADVLYDNSDIGNSRNIARRIVEVRSLKKLMTTHDLRDAIGTKNPKILAPIFQALRIEVNGDYRNLQFALDQSQQILEVGARIIVISYHSGEDRIVKNYFRNNSDKLTIITKKPITPSDYELKQNTRSRSAKMRVAEVK
jgi:16S rRNA (cytosine1402-N4)-methyltransferase